MERIEASGWYLVRPVSQAAEPPVRRRRFRFDWKKLVLALLVGGLVGGSLASSRIKAGRIPTIAPREDAKEVARLQARNRRLEALVWTLRQKHPESLSSR